MVAREASDCYYLVWSTRICISDVGIMHIIDNPSILFYDNIIAGQLYVDTSRYIIFIMSYARIRTASVQLLCASSRVAEDSGSFGSFVGINRLCTDGKLNEALQTVHCMQRQGLQLTTDILHCILQGCMKKEDVTVGKAVHCLIVTSGLESHTLLGTLLIRMFAVCGRLVEAKKVFDKLPKPNVFTWSAIISAHAKLGQGEQAIKLYYQMRESSMKSDAHTFVAVLKACASSAALTHGRLIHFQIMQTGFDSDLFIGNTLIDMYSKCGSFSNAHLLFDRLLKRDVVTWSVMITACIEQGDHREALELFVQMQEECIEPDLVTFVCVLRACSSLAALDQGKLIHAHIVENGFESAISLNNTIIDMYAKCASLDDGKCVFDRLSMREVVTWNVMIAGYAANEDGDVAVELFKQMLHEGKKPNQASFVSILRVCSSMTAVSQGKLIHVYIKESGFDLDVSVGNALINMYAKCGNLEDALKLFNTLPKRDVMTWNAMISVRAQHGHILEAFQLLEQMSQYGMEPDGVSFVSILKACSCAIALTQGKVVHSYMIESGLGLDVNIANSLIDMYVKCSSFRDACWVFDRLQRRDVITWSTMIAGCAQHGRCQQALQLFQHMSQEGVEPDQVTFVCILKALSGIAGMYQGKLIHVQIVGTGLDYDLFVGNTLIDMYIKCESLEDACIVFDQLKERNIVTWNAMIAGYVQYGRCQEACVFFLQMQEKGLEPNQVTFGCILRTCSDITDLHQGKLYHGHIIDCGFECDVYLANTLIDMYVNCGSLEDACRVFDRLPNQDVVTFNSMISGYAIHGYGLEMFRLLHKMLQDGIEPDKITFVCTLKACSGVVALHQGRFIHCSIMKCGFDSDAIVGNALVNMYAKCGGFEDACLLCDRLPKNDVRTWGALIAGCAQYSNYKLALQYADDMLRKGLKPNEVIFGSLLSVCSSLGLVDEGYCHFKSMVDDHGIAPTLEHWNCMVDLLGRAGRLNEAEDFLRSMPFGLNVVGWMFLLSQCRNHGNVELGQRCFGCLLAHDSKKAGSYMLMSHIYADVGIQVEAEKVEELRKSANALKEPGNAFIKVADEVHKFIVEGMQHPLNDDIFFKLRGLAIQLKVEGYMPSLDLVLQSIPDKDQENTSSRSENGCGIPQCKHDFIERKWHDVKVQRVCMQLSLEGHPFDLHIKKRGCNIKPVQFGVA